MFGYVKAHNPELKVRESDYYRAFYCGLCRTMKSRCGFSSTLTLSYDIVFLALVRTAITGARGNIKRMRCPMHPVRGRLALTLVDSDILDYCAGVAALLTEGKLEDDVLDERGVRRLRARLLLPAARRVSKRAGCGDDLRDTVRRYLSELNDTENSRPESVDACADIFGGLLGEIFAYGLPCERSRRIAYEIGRGAGRFIYVADAANDAAEDAAAGRYNPVLSVWHDHFDGVMFDDHAKDATMTALQLDLSVAATAVELIDTQNGAPPEALSIIKNIIYLGMPAAAKAALSGKAKNKRWRQKQIS
ncbi:MAG: DUF5685 family protein [Eubacteriales bacterium]